MISVVIEASISTSTHESISAIGLDYLAYISFPKPELMSSVSTLRRADSFQVLLSQPRSAKETGAPGLLTQFRTVSGCFHKIGGPFLGA